MRFSEFNKVTEDIGLPTEKGVTGPLGSYRPGSDKKVWGTGKTAIPPYPIDGPAKVYSGNNEYYNTTKDDPLGKTRPSTDRVSATQPVSAQQAPATKTTTPGTMSTADRFRQVDNGQIKPNINPGPNTSNIPTLDPVADAAGKAAKKSIGKRVLGSVIPVAGSALDAEEAYRRYQLGDKSGAVISALGAAGGAVPGLGAPVSWGAAGLNLAKDMSGLTDKEIAWRKEQEAQAAQRPQAELGYGPGKRAPITKADYEQLAAQKVQTTPVATTPTSRLSQKQMAAAQAAPNSGSTAQRSTYTTDQQAIKDRIANTQTQQNANTGVEQPKQLQQLQQPRQSYAGTPGAQAIQRANPGTIQDVNSIKAGDTINLPNNAGQYVVKPGDTLDKIAHNQLTAPTAQASTTTTTTPNNSTDDTFRNQNLEKMKNQASTSSTTPPATKDVSSVQAEETNPLHRIKSLAGLK